MAADVALAGQQVSLAKWPAADCSILVVDEPTVAIQRWWALAGACQQRVETAGEGEQWAPMTGVFHVD